jgi:hypothetical protein
MRINLYSLILAPAVLAVAALAAQPAVAESHLINVPFSFVANGKVCPAGAYRVSRENFSGTIRLTGAHNSFVWLLVAGNGAVRDHRLVLTFDVAGQNHMLRTVEYGPMSTPQIDKKYTEDMSAGRQIALVQ